MSKKETKNERIKRIFAESVADQKRQDEAGVPGAHLRWALAEAILEALNTGHQITDLDCFRLDPRYTGSRDSWHTLNLPAPDIVADDVVGKDGASIRAGRKNAGSRQSEAEVEIGVASANNGGHAPHAGVAAD